MTTVDPRRLVFVDEAGSHIAMTRKYAWSTRNTRAVGSVPRNRGTVLTMLGGMGLDGMRAMMTVEGGTNEEVFLAFVTEVLAPTLRPGDIVVLDKESKRVAATLSGGRVSFMSGDIAARFAA